MPVRLSPILEPAADVILVGDPRRAFALGQALTVQPRMSHLSRGLWGYSGETGGGHPLTVQSTGIGGPSAAVVIGDLAELGVKRMVRLGTCVATAPVCDADEPVEGLPRPGDSFLISRAHSGDGTSRSLAGGSGSVLPDPTLTRSLSEVAGPAEVFSHDLVSRLDRSPTASGPAPLRDLQTAATFAAADSLGVAAAAVLVVVGGPSGTRLDEPALERIFEPIGGSVAAVLER